jgi:hypothetical protein
MNRQSAVDPIIPRTSRRVPEINGGLEVLEELLAAGVGAGANSCAEVAGAWVLIECITTKCPQSLMTRGEGVNEMLGVGVWNLGERKWITYAAKVCFREEEN